jgi:putative ABC transport system ATP-binding protein
MSAVLRRSQPEAPAQERVAAIEIRGLNHVLGGHGGAEGQFTLQIAELRIPKGCFCSITGPNGCGKTTLLTIMGLLQKPTEVQDFTLRIGTEAHLDDYRVGELWQSRAGRRTIQWLRRSELGFVLQSGGLLESLTAYENMDFVLRANGRNAKESRRRIDEICGRLHFEDEWKPRTPTRLSGGQQQITALARAIAHDPSLVLVDEPTASLHPDWARNTLTLLKQMQQQRGSDLTVIMVSHDAALAEEFGTYHVRMQVDLQRMCGYVDTTAG